jgi:hypothetical protein
MNGRLRTLLVLASTLSLGASYRSGNFHVEAPTTSMAQEVSQKAEKLRKELAQAWLGKEMKAWNDPLPIDVKITGGAPGGYSSFSFDDAGRVSRQRMQVEGSLERIINGVLPHEMTHVLFAHHFGKQPPRWADEGGAILGEDKTMWAKHDQGLFQVLDTPNRRLALGRLFGSDYTPDLQAFYAEAASVSRFLVSKADRATFLAFVNQGMRDGWDAAVKQHYRFRNVDELEVAWLQQVKQSRAKPGDSPRAERK